MSTLSQIEYALYIQKYILLAMERGEGVISVRTRLEESLPLIFERLCMSEAEAEAKTSSAIDPTLSTEKTQPVGAVAGILDEIRRSYFRYRLATADVVEDDTGYWSP